MHPRAPIFVISCLLPAAALAEPTLTLSVSGPTEVLSGDPESSSVDARGIVGMGPLIAALGTGVASPITAMLAIDRSIWIGTAGGTIHRLDAAGVGKKIHTAEKLIVASLAQHKGRLIAATHPEGNVLVFDGEKATPLVDPQEKYVWAMLSDGERLLLATGEPGRVVEVAGGKTKAIFEPEETHVRALIRHPKRGLIAGGGQKGIVYQLTPAGGAFALYDSGMDEVTAFAIDPESGDLYAAIVSESKPGALIPEKSIGAVAGDPADTGSPIKGSEVVRIGSTGRVDVVWTSRREGALALAFDPKAKRLTIATGAGPKARGRLYAIDLADRDRVRLFARVEPPIASTLALGAGGELIVGTSPAGQVLRVGPTLRTDSIYLSSEQDLHRSARVGRIWFDGDVPAGASIEVSIRSGNTKIQDSTWSVWSTPVKAPLGGSAIVPEARYIQFRAKLVAAPKGAAPALKALYASVLRKNLAPTVVEVFLLRPGVYMRAMPQEEEKEKTVTLSQSQVQRLRKASDDEREVRVRQGVTPGMLTAAWKTDDPNHDDLIYRVELRRVDPEGPWLELGDDLEHPFFTFDTRAFPDGRYQVRAIASDRPSNPPSEALSDQNVSEPFNIDSTPPRIRSLNARPVAGGLEVKVEAEDVTSPLTHAELSIDGGPWLMLPAVDGLTDARTESFELELTPKDRPGDPKLERKRVTVSVRVEDAAENTSFASTAVER